MKSLRTAFAILILLGGFIGGARLVAAQDTGDATAVPSYPAYVHEGTCDNLTSNPAATLDEVTVRGHDDDEDKTPEPQGALDAPLVLHSDSDADLKLDDLLATPHAVAIRESAEQADVVLACGDIGGMVVDDDLYIALAPVDDSGFYGIAKLSTDDDKTEVEIFLVQPNQGEPAATPAA